MQSCLALIPDDTDLVYLAYSGGLDSSVLLHLLVSSQPRYRIIPWHVNHGLQDSALQMEQFCIDHARQYGLEARVDRLEPGSIESNVEATARRLRYRLFEDGNGPQDCVLTAHHADDQAETFLLNALRGSGSAGLRGIARCRQLGSGQLLRPLLDYSRRQLEEYAQFYELAWFNDPSNSDLRFDRNYLRNQVFPVLAARWPHYQTALSTSSQLQGETQEMLDELAHIDLQALSRSTAGNNPTLDLTELVQLSPGRRRNLLRYWIAQAGLPAMPGSRLQEVMNQLGARVDAIPEIAMPDYSIRLYDQRLFLVPVGTEHDCHGVFEFGLATMIEINDCKLRCSRKDLFSRLQIEDHKQLVSVRFRDAEQPAVDRHRLKRLFQKHRVPPWKRPFTAQVYLDGELAGLLL